MVTYKEYTLDPFQEDAIEAITKNHSVVVSAPTGSGKTLIADFIINRDHNEKKVIYTAPIKALSNQKYKDFCNDYGRENVGLMTGDTVINPGANIVIMTTEIYRNMALSKDEMIMNVSYLILDEIHYINDIERGTIWEESIIFSPESVRFLCLSATIPNAKEFAAWIRSIKQHDVDVVIHTHRPVPLKTSFYAEALGITSMDDIQKVKHIPHMHRGKKEKWTPKHYHVVFEIKDKLPCLFFCFSRAACERNATELMRKWKELQPDPDITVFILKKLREAPPEVAQLSTCKALKELLPRGIAFHHAGVIPILKEIVEELFGMGKIKVLYATETFAVGINMPAKTVCFESLRKFNGITFGLLTSKEFFQMAGRAGRRGIDPIGYVIAMLEPSADLQRIKVLTTSDTEPLHSQFKLSINTVLNLIKNHSPRERDIILRQSFFTFRTRKEEIIIGSFKKKVKQLVRMGYLEGDRLTEKGQFAAMMYVDEIIFTELFCTDLWKQFSDYQIMLIFASLVFEGREKAMFQHQHVAKEEKIVFKKTKELIGQRAKRMHDLTALIHPLFSGKTFFDLLLNTNLAEGDVIRIFNQILDRIQQVQRATPDSELRQRLQSCFALIKNCIETVS